jgi:putative IMPACT (imprinted ancient) family translation regulator
MDAALKAGQLIRAYRRAVATVETTAAAIDPIKEAALARIDKAAA